VNREKVNHLSGVLPVVMSLLAFLIVMAVVATGWQRYDHDEGTAAHLFQLLILLEAPLIITFLATADWRRFAPIVSRLVMQAGALGLAFGSVAWFRL
jgi:hypothetical protein